MKLLFHSPSIVERLESAAQNVRNKEYKNNKVTYSYYILAISFNIELTYCLCLEFHPSERLVVLNDFSTIW